MKEYSTGFPVVYDYERDGGDIYGPHAAPVKPRIDPVDWPYDQGVRTLPATSRKDSTLLLLDHIAQLQREYAAREDHMVQLAIGTGCTSLVNSVRGMGLALEAARKRVERVAPKERTK